MTRDWYNRCKAPISEVFFTNLDGMDARLVTAEPLRAGRKAPQAKRDESLDAVQGELTPSHRFMLGELMQHIEYIEARIARFDN